MNARAPLGEGEDAIEVEGSSNTPQTTDQYHESCVLSASALALNELHGNIGILKDRPPLHKTLVVPCPDDKITRGPENAFGAKMLTDEVE